MKYFSLNRTERGTDMAINFFLTYYLDKKGDKQQTGLELDEQLSKWLEHLQDGAWSNWCFGSHDSRRVTSRLPSVEMIDGFLMLLLLQKGTALIYYGDEIGKTFNMVNNPEVMSLLFSSFRNARSTCRPV